MGEGLKKLNAFVVIAAVAILAIPLIALRIYHHLLTPVSTSGSSVIFVINPGESVSKIASDLQQKKLVRSPFAFKLLVARLGVAKKIEAGDFRLSPTMSSQEIALTLTHGALDVWVTIPEGFRSEEIGERLQKSLGINPEDFGKAAEEGYMFPDTYLIPKESSADDVAKIMKKNFQNKVDDKLKSASSSKLSDKELLILASIVEREARSEGERPVVASVLLNRLNIGMALQADATVQYTLGKSKNDKWWPPVGQEDYKVKSKFNTYLSAGLPPSPICNPGLASISAVASPANTDYLYYLHDKDGHVHFAKTLDEHNANIAKYL